MTQRQQKIYNGLLSIGEEIASFYKDALIIKESELSTKSYLLAHCAREIDAGMRDIFAPKSKVIEKCITCNSEINKSTESHLDSICKMLDVPTNSAFAKKWKKIAENFPANAHRRGAYKLPRPVDKITEYWEDYENILFELFGYFNSKLRLVERLVKYEIPTEPMLLTLSNFFQNKIVKFEFYKELKSPEWLIPLFERGFFNPANIENEYPSEDDNKRFISPNWIELHYLVNMGQINSNVPLPSVSACLLKFINSYIDYRDSNGNPIKNSLTNMRLIELIITLPSNLIEDSHLNFIFQNVNKESFISYELIENFIPKLIKEDSKNILFKVIQFYIEPYEVIPNPINSLFDEESSSEVKSSIFHYKTYDSVLNGNDFADIFYDKIASIAEKFGLELFNLLKEAISKKIETSESYLFDTNSIPNIRVRSNDFYFTNEPFKVIIQIAYKLLYYSNSDTSETLQKLFNSNEEIFQRIALQLLAEKYDEYNSVFWKLSFTLVNNRYIDYEFSLLIQNNIHKFSASQISQLIQIIETYDSDYFQNNEFPKEENEKYRCYKVLQFLLLLQPANLSQIDDKISDYNARTDHELQQISHSFSNDLQSSYSFGETIPESAKLFDQKIIEEIAQYLINFDEKDKFGRSLINGAYQMLHEDILSNPSKYFPYLDNLIDIDENCLNQVIIAIENLGNENKGDFIYWQESLEFIEKWLSKNNYECKGVISSILTIIEDFTREDSIAFDIAFMPIAKKMLIKFSTILKPETTNIQKIEHSLSNIDYTRLIHAMMEFSLRDARINKRNQSEKWDFDIKTWIESELQNNPSIDLYMALGSFFNNFDFLSEGWFSSKIDLLLPQNDTYWVSALSLYTFKQNIPPHIYKKLLVHGDYKRILNYTGDFVKLDLLKERVLNLICWYYLAKGFDKDSESGISNDSKSILDEIISNEHPKELEAIVRTLVIEWSSKETLQNDDGDFVYLLRQIFEILERNAIKQEYQPILGKFNETISLLSNLNEDVTKWFKFSIRYLNKRGDTEKVLAGLKLHSQNNLQQVGEILIEFSKDYNNVRMRLYGLEDLKYIVDLLFNKNYLDVADEICDNFGNSGFQELKEVYDKYHPL